MLRLIPSPHQPIAVLRTGCIRNMETRQHARSAQPLMALAGLAAARLALAVAPHARRIWIAAGPGNNGGDGLEAASHLHRWGIDVQVSLMGSPEQLPPDAHAAWKTAVACGVTISPTPPQAWLSTLTTQDLCIDALLGIGASRAPSAAMQAWIENLNHSPAPVLALDIPTGLDADSGQIWAESPSSQHVVKAAHTLTFLAAKPGLFMGHGRDVAGDIWLDTLTSACPPDTPPQTVDAWLNPQPTLASKPHASHKGSHGDVAVIGGEPMHLNGMGMTGAAVLAAQAALHGGAGRVILSLLGDAREHLAAPADLMQRPFAMLDLPRLTVVAGCGGGQAITDWLKGILQFSAKLVLDADALNAVASHSTLRALLRARGDTSGQQPTVITPHPLEAARLLGCTTSAVQRDRLQAAKTLSEELQCTVVLKGSGTVISSPSQSPCINTSGNGLLAVGGTGDVLAGLIGAHLAQGHTAHQAACQATWLHGSQADQWPRDQALTASRLANSLH